MAFENIPGIISTVLDVFQKVFVATIKFLLRYWYITIPLFIIYIWMRRRKKRNANSNI